MRLTRQQRFGAWALAALVFALAGFFAGGALRPGEEPHYLFDVEAAAYDAPTVIAATSPGGFTGFGETDGGASRVVVSGRVVEMTATEVTLEGPHGQRTALRFGEEPRILRLEGASAELLSPGDAVAVRLNAAGDTVEGVLILSQR